MVADNRRRYKGRVFEHRAEALRRNSVPICWICGEWIDLRLDYRDPASWTADHVIPIAEGGDLDYGELRPAHRACNSRRGRRIMKPPLPIDEFPTSREW